MRCAKTIKTISAWPDQNYQQKIQDIRNGYAPETGGDEVNKISFEFKTAWDDFKLFDLAERKI